jgi:uncharacterized C2H2 Zn-finger protein
MEAVGATGISSTSTIFTSFEGSVNTKNIYETKPDKKLPINISSNDKQNESIYGFNCKCGAILRSKFSLARHVANLHGQTGYFLGNHFKITANLNPQPKLKCPECNLFFKHTGSLRGHLSVSHGLNCTFENEVILFTTDKSTGDKKIYNSSNNIQAINIKKGALKTQNNTNATNTTTDNMDSTRKRSHSPDRYNEESNAKKAMLNPSESGYLQSSDTRSSISNSCEEDTTFSNRFLDGITADDSFVTPIAGNTASINTAFQFSATSQDIDDTELLELARELLQTNNDFKTALSGDASYSAASRDSYLQFSVTPKKV